MISDALYAADAAEYAGEVPGAANCDFYLLRYLHFLCISGIIEMYAARDAAAESE